MWRKWIEKKNGICDCKNYYVRFHNRCIKKCGEHQHLAISGGKHQQVIYKM